MYLSVLPKADLCRLSSMLFHLPDDILLRRHCPYTPLQAVAILHQSQGRSMRDHPHLPDDRSLYTCSRTLQSHLKQEIHGRILPEYRTVSCSLLSVLHRTIFLYNIHCPFTRICLHHSWHSFAFFIEYAAAFPCFHYFLRFF